MATILLLALTVTLFAAIFAFVTSFPAPPSQNNNQFQASLVLAGNASYVVQLRITHLAGPSVPGSAWVYLKSAAQPNASEFRSPYNPYSVSGGLGGASTWNLGQVWMLNFTSSIGLPSASGNITVYIISGSSLLFSVILPGTSLAPAPTIVSTSIAPATPVIGQSFTVYATISGAYSSNSVYVNLQAVPGGPNTPQKMTQNAQGEWTYLFSGATSNGTFYGFVNASNAYGQTTTAAVAITIYTTGSGTVNGPFSVGVILIPSPANGNTTEAVQAVVTYTGVLSSPANLNVTFTAISNPYVTALKWTGWAPTTTISGGTSETVASKTTWFIPSPFTHPSVTAGTSFIVYANATVSGVGTVPGKLTFTPAYLNTGPTKTALIGYALTTNGSYFQPNTVVMLSIGGVAQTLTSCSTGTISASKTNVTTSSSGTFTCTFSVAAGTPALAANLLASAPTSGQNATASFTPIDWTISPLSPTTGRIGIAVNVTGSGFVASSSVSLLFDGSSVKVTSCSSGTAGSSAVTATASGGFVCKFGIPYGVGAGAGSLVATDSTGSQTAVAPFTVTAWTITTSPTKLYHGTSQKVYINGTGFAPSSYTGTTGSNLTIALNGTLLTSGSLSFACTVGVLTGSTVNLTYGGSFACSITLGKAAAAGVYTFTATDYTSGQIATAVFERT